MRISEASSCCRGGRLAAPLLALSLLAGCESDTAELIREIDAARAGCTQEKLRAGDEECVQMMERYAEMGNEAIRTYIGAVKSMDQALQRMPAPAFDTAGLGNALTHPPEAYRYGGDSLLGAQRAFDPEYAYPYPAEPQRQLSPQAAPGSYGWGEPAYRRDPSGYGPAPYERSGPYPGSARGGEDRYDEDRYDPYEEQYPAGRRYADPYSGGPYRGAYAPDGYGAPADERTRWRNSPERLPYPYRPEQYERWPQGRTADPRALPPERGQLLPPEERLRRPWLDEQREDPRDPRSRRRYAPEPRE